MEEKEISNEAQHVSEHQTPVEDSYNQDDGQNLANKQEQTDRELVSNLTQQIEVMQDKLLRAIAESENIRHRMNKMIEEARDYSIISFAKDLVPVVDNLSRALSHLPENLDNDSKIIVEGVQMTKDELESVFKKHGLELIQPQEGENFNYNNHHAIAQVVTDQYKEGTIVNTMQVGYRIKDRLIRPASVSVAKMM